LGRGACSLGVGIVSSQAEDEGGASEQKDNLLSPLGKSRGGVFPLWERKT